MQAGRLAVLFLALGCQGTTGGVLPDAREYDASTDPCSLATDWVMKEAKPIAAYDRPPGVIAVDQAFAYWTEPHDCPDDNCMGAAIVFRAPLAGGERETLLDGQVDQPGSLAVTREYLFVTVGEQMWRLLKDGTGPEVVGAAHELAADADAIYYVEDGILVRLAAETLEATPVGEVLAFGIDLQLAGGAAWWFGPEMVDVWRMPLSSGVAERAFDVTGAIGGSLAVDGLGRAFVVTRSVEDPGTPALLVRFAADGLESEPIVELSDGIAGVGVDDAFVYWVEPSVRRLSRMPLDGGCIETRDLGLVTTELAPATEGIVIAADTIALVER